MARMTQVDPEKIQTAQTKLVAAIDAVRAAMRQLDSHTVDFYAATGTGEKNGHLDQQSIADMENKNKQYTDTNDAVEHDQRAAREAYGQYTGVEAGNSASLQIGVCQIDI